MSEEVQADIGVVAGLAGRPVTVEELAAVTGLDPSEIMAAAAAAERAGTVVASGTGYVAEAPAASPRVAFLAGRFAELVVGRGGSAAEAGRLLRAAGRDADALPHLVKAAEAGDNAALGAALAVHEAVGGLTPAVEGDLRIRHAAELRGRGRSDDAYEQARLASRRLDGAKLVDALGFAAAIADDLQKPQVSEALTALAAATAAGAGEPAKEGSLLTLQARALSRIGFPDEADVAMAKGQAALAEHGSPEQRRTARTNEALIMLDRGEARRAASAFDSLLAADDGSSGVSTAVAEVYVARSLFATGNSARALPLAAHSLAVCVESGAAAPTMLAHMALAEGALVVRRPVDALASADAAMAVVERDLPQWVNRMHLLRASAFLQAGDTQGAVAAVDAGLDTSPDGADGWRVRRQLEAIRLMATPSDTKWPTAAAEELTDDLLQARWYGIAVELMVERARREGDTELGLEAAALAHRLGSPMAAAAAIAAVDGWKTPEAIPVAQAVKDLERNIAPEWLDEWRTLPEVVSALAADTSADVEDDLLDARIDDALRAAGLAGVDAVLSPAQRRSKGLVRRKVRRRQGLPWWGWAAAVVVVAGLSYGMAQLVTPENTTVVQTVVTTAPPETTPPLEATVVGAEDLSGVFAHRGSERRTGEGTGGFRELEGIAWPNVRPGGFLGSLVVHGIRAFVASTTSDAVYAIELSTGRVITELETDDRVIAAPAVGVVEGTRGDSNRTLLVAVSQAGTVYGKEPGSPTLLWEVALDEPVTASPLMTGKIAVVATAGGHIHGLGGGGLLWTYPLEGEEPIGAVTSAPSFGDGVIYVVAGSEMIGLREDGSEVCRGSVSAGGTATGSPMATGEVTLVQTEAGLVRVDPGKCGPGIPDPGTPRDQPPAYANGVVYSVQGEVIFSFEPGTLTGETVNAAGNETVGYWPAVFAAGSAITGQPSVADGVVYVGTQAGDVYAIDAETGVEIWVFHAGSKIEGSPAPIPGAVLVITADGEVIAIVGG